MTTRHASRASKPETFFLIQPPEADAQGWARRNWDRYGFDYSMGYRREGLLAWPHGTTAPKLAANLRRAKVRFTTFREVPERLFGITD